MSRTRSSGWQSAIVLATVLSSFLLIAMFLGLVALRLLGRSSKICPKEIRKFNTLDIDIACDLVKPKLPKTVLLLWVQDEGSLAHQVTQFKLLLASHCNAKVPKSRKKTSSL